MTGDGEEHSDNRVAPEERKDSLASRLLTETVCSVIFGGTAGAIGCALIRKVNEDYNERVLVYAGIGALATFAIASGYQLIHWYRNRNKNSHPL